MHIAVKLGLGFVGIILLSYAFLSTTSKEHKQVEKSRSLEFESTGIDNIILQGKQSITESSKIEIENLEHNIAATSDAAEKKNHLLRLSDLWFDLKQYAIAGHFIEQIANTEKSDSSWAIAGTIYTSGILQNTKDNISSYCFNHAVSAFENAISLSPSNLQHQMNLALLYVQQPPSDNPMKGILSLRSIAEAKPDYLPAQLQLVQLAIQTAQWDRAKSRLETILKKDINHVEANCLMVTVLEQLKQTELISTYINKCNKN